MNTIDDRQIKSEKNEGLSKETLGVVSETLASTNLGERIDILPSTEVKDIFPVLEAETKISEVEIKN